MRPKKITKKSHPEMSPKARRVANEVVGILRDLPECCQRRVLASAMVLCDGSLVRANRVLAEAQ